MDSFQKFYLVQMAFSLKTIVLFYYSITLIIRNLEGYHMCLVLTLLLMNKLVSMQVTIVCAILYTDVPKVINCSLHYFGDK